MKPPRLLLTSREMVLGPSLRRGRKRSDRVAVRLAAAVVASLLLNLLLFNTAERLGAFDLAKPREVRQVALAPLTADQWNANRAITGTPPAPAQQRPPQQAQALPPPPPPLPSGPKQVVEVAPSQNAKRPADSKYLAERDNTVEKETRSRHAGKKLYDNTLPAPSEAAPQRQGAPAAGEEGQSARSKPGKQGPSGPLGTDAERLALLERPRKRLAPRPTPTPGGADPEGLAPEEERAHAAAKREEQPKAPGLPDAGEGAEPLAGRLDPRLLPGIESMARIAGGPSNDALHDLEEGEQTALNTIGFKHATFFNRFKRAVSGQWNPDRAYLSRDPDGTMFGAGRYTTAIGVVLDGSGAIKELRMLQQSGLVFLDQEAVRALRAAAPFPNPPSALVSPQGEVKFVFGFEYDIRRESRLRFERRGF